MSRDGIDRLLAMAVSREVVGDIGPAGPGPARLADLYENSVCMIACLGAMASDAGSAVGQLAVSKGLRCPSSESMFCGEPRLTKQPSSAGHRH